VDGVLTIHQSGDGGVGIRMVNMDTQSVPAGFHTSQQDIHASGMVYNSFSIKYNRDKITLCLRKTNKAKKQFLAIQVSSV
jgi:hypothetical protein